MPCVGFGVAMCGEALAGSWPPPPCWASWHPRFWRTPTTSHISTFWRPGNRSGSRWIPTWIGARTSAACRNGCALTTCARFQSLTLARPISPTPAFRHFMNCSRISRPAVGWPSARTIALCRPLLPSRAGPAGLHTTRSRATSTPFRTPRGRSRGSRTTRPSQE
jgi:hypothetical protein